jgi:type IV secretory pathway ATPase VirB11/archaellum biosynthesis ATPase
MKAEEARRAVLVDGPLLLKADLARIGWCCTCYRMGLYEGFSNCLATQVFSARASGVVCEPSGVTLLANSRIAAIPNQARIKRATDGHPARLDSFPPEVAPLI